MKIISFALLVLCLSSLLEAQSPANIAARPGRYEKTINSEWTFNYFPTDAADKGFEAATLNDSKWSAVALPHTWSTYETSGDIHPFIMNASEKENPYWWTGWGWYRKHFSIRKEYSGKKVFVEFDGVQKYCKVWLNGRYLGDHKGGYGSFDFDISNLVNFGSDNVLAVAVSNRQNDQFSIPPMSAGNFNVYGGIYRDVRIVLKDKLYIPMQGSATHEGGHYITTPSVSEKEASTRIQTWVKNDYPQKKTCILRTRVIDQNGRTVLQVQTSADIEPLGVHRFDQVMPLLKNPRLWSPETPNLYTAISDVVLSGVAVDSYTSSFGYRWYWWDYNENFLYLNGKKLVLTGGNRHQEYPWLGDAVPVSLTVADMSDIKNNLNYNFLRTAHYPNDRRVYDLADKLGIIIDEEAPNIKNQDFSEEVQQLQLTEMIRRDRNHPSIIFWSMGNETDKAVDSRFAAAEDTTRILTARRVSGNSAGAFVKHGEANLAIEDQLRCTVRGWYNTDVRNLEPGDGQQCGTEEHHVNMLIKSGKIGTGNLVTWLYADHGADREYLNSPLLHVNPKGFVDMYRIPKYAYWFWQANYSAKPVLFIQPHFWRPQYTGQVKAIVVHSNCDKVELKVNGVSKGVKTPAASGFNTVVFEGITVGKGILSAVGTQGTKTVTTQVAMAAEPARIIVSSVSQLEAGKGSVALVTADITDASGNHVYGATNTLRWNVSGPATLVGPQVYESDIQKNNSPGGTGYTDTPVSNIIRSNGQPGTIRVTVSSTGLGTGYVDIKATEAAREESFITETSLKDEGRLPVARPGGSQPRPQASAGELKSSVDDIVVKSGPVAETARSIREIILKMNPAVDTATVEFRELTRLFVTHSLNNEGRIIADDYNFIIGYYNNCRTIARYIAATKLPQLFRDGLRSYYADDIIKKGSNRNAAEEMNWMNWIPSGGTVVVSSERQSPEWPKGTIVSSQTDLADLIAIVHPVFRGFSEEAKERALTFIARMNPFVTKNSVNVVGADGKNVTSVTFSATRNKPVLIPLLKFISE